jgi:hypothetical protein
VIFRNSAEPAGRLCDYWIWSPKKSPVHFQRTQRSVSSCALITLSFVSVLPVTSLLTSPHVNGLAWLDNRGAQFLSATPLFNMTLKRVSPSGRFFDCVFFEVPVSGVHRVALGCSFTPSAGTIPSNHWAAGLAACNFCNVRNKSRND